MSNNSYGASHPLDVKAAQTLVSDENRFTRTRDSMHKQLEDRAERIRKFPANALDVVVDYLSYQYYMGTEVLATAVDPGDAVGQIRWRGRIEQVRTMAEEIASIAAMKREQDKTRDEKEE